MFTVNGVKVRVIMKNIGVIPRRILGKWFWLDEVEIEQKLEGGEWVDIRFSGISRTGHLAIRMNGGSGER